MFAEKIKNEINQVETTQTYSGHFGDTMVGVDVIFRNSQTSDGF